MISKILRCLVLIKLAPMGPTLKLHVYRRGRRGGQQASCLVAKQAVEFPQVLASV